MNYEIEDQSNIPQELLTALEDGKVIQILSCIGWLDFTEDEPPEFRCGNTYRVKAE